MIVKWEDIQAQAEQDAKYLEQAPDDFNKNDVQKAQKALIILLLLLIDDFDTEDGKILKNTKNFYKVNKVDQAFNKYKTTAGLFLIRSLMYSFQKVVSNGFKYFQTLLGVSQKLKDTQKEITEMFNERLGINANGTLVEDGYMNTIFDTTTIRNQTREIFYKAVLSGDKPSALRDEVTNFIGGGHKDGVDLPGEIEKFYSKYVGDTFSKIDRMASARFGKAFDLQWFVYYGTIIQTSRPFCRKHIGGIYNITEAQDWINQIPAPVGVSVFTYDPVIDMGGIRCRHLPKFITVEMKDDLINRGFSTVPSNE